MWDDLEAAGTEPQGVVLFFREARRYKVNLTLLREPLGEAADAKLLLDRLDQRFPGGVYR